MKTTVRGLKRVIKEIEHQETPADVAREVQVSLNQVRERLIEVEMLTGDEWPPEFAEALRVANEAVDKMEAECDRVRQEPTP